MEFGVSEVLPNYSGGLGVLAGDHLKAASDLGVPLIGVGLLYRSGYFRQSLSLDGWQLETYPVLDPQGLPLHLLADADGRAGARRDRDARRAGAAGARLAGRGRAGAAAAARLRHRGERPRPARRHRPALRRRPGPPHPPGDPRRHRRGARRPRVLRDHRAPAARGVPHQRGPRGLPRPGAHPGAVHEPGPHVRRGARRPSARAPCSPRTRRCPRASTASRSTWSATTSTRTCCPGVPTDRVLALGARGQPEHVQHGAHGPAAGPARQRRVEAARRGVARHVRRRCGSGFDADEVPIGSVTNGVHGTTWEAREVAGLPRRARTQPGAGRRLRRAALGRCATPCARRLVEEVRRRVREAWLQRGASLPELGWTEHVFDPDVLTVGFARRVPTYKRLTLMLRDKERLRDLLLDPRAARAARRRRASRTPPTTAARRSSSRSSASPTTRPCATASCSCPTTTCRWPATCTGAATCG